MCAYMCARVCVSLSDKLCAHLSAGSSIDFFVDSIVSESRATRADVAICVFAYLLHGMSE